MLNEAKENTAVNPVQSSDAGRATSEPAGRVVQPEPSAKHAHAAKSLPGLKIVQVAKSAPSTRTVSGVEIASELKPTSGVKATQLSKSASTEKLAQANTSTSNGRQVKDTQPVQRSKQNVPDTVTPSRAVAPSVNVDESSTIATDKVNTFWKKTTPLQRELGLFVLLPTLLVFIYTALIWSPMYVSETKFAVRSGTEQSYGVDIASQLLKTSNTSTQDAEVVEAYVRSPDIFEALDKELKVVEHYTSSEWDWFSRLTSSPTLWDKQTFWNWVSKPVVNPDNGIVTYTVRAYDPAMAQAISRAVLNRSEALVNEMNERARKDTLALAEKEVKIAKDRVAKAQQALEEFRNQHRDLDPQATATGLQSIVFELEGERAKLRAEIEDAQSYMKASAPQLKNMQSRLAALEKQLAVEKARLVNQEGKEALNSWVSGYETLMIESEFAKKQLTTAMTAMETARASLLSKTRYIVPIEQPTLPDESRYPNTWIFTICTFLGLLLLYGLIRLIVASIREHAGF